ncbi:MAG: hypothetical protein RLZZ241_664 [Bacteroidota bacterium]|jgi:hypothetical protein
MKLRIEGNSLRFRLRKTEVEALSRHESIGESTNFPHGVLQYRVQLDSGIDDLNAQILDNEIILYVPEKFGKPWYTNDIVGCENTLKLQNGSTLSVLIEKDFVCLDRDLASQHDQYPHPKGPSRKP